jgi:hypothetical protein
MSTPFKKRSGSTIRECNINTVIEMLRKGISEKDIMTLLAMSFCPDTRTDYLNTAKEKLEMENSLPKEKQQSQQEEKVSSNNTESESLVDYAKTYQHTTNECRNCGKPIPDNLTFCSKECVKEYKAEEEESNK